MVGGHYYKRTKRKRFPHRLSLFMALITINIRNPYDLFVYKHFNNGCHYNYESSRQHPYYNFDYMHHHSHYNSIIIIIIIIIIVGVSCLRLCASV